MSQVSEKELIVLKNIKDTAKLLLCTAPLTADGPPIMAQILDSLKVQIQLYDTVEGLAQIERDISKATAKSRLSD